MKTQLDLSDYLVKPGSSVELNEFSTSITGPSKNKQEVRKALADDASDLREVLKLSRDQLLAEELGSGQVAAL